MKWDRPTKCCRMNKWFVKYDGVFSFSAEFPLGLETFASRERVASYWLESHFHKSIVYFYCNVSRILYRRSSATWFHRRHFMYLFDIWYFWPTTEALLVCQKDESWVTWPVSTWTSFESHVARTRSQPISIQKLVPPGTRLLLIGCPPSSRMQ